MSVFFYSMESFLFDKKFFLAPANDLSNKFFESLSEEEKNNFSCYLDSRKEGENIKSPDTIEIEDVVILSSPLYWREIVSGLKSDSVYLNTINGLIHVNDYTRLIDSRKYFDCVINVIDPLFHDESIKIAEIMKGRFHSIAIISPLSDSRSCFNFLDRNVIQDNFSCYIAISLNGYQDVKSERSISIFYSVSAFEKKPPDIGNKLLNILHFSGYKPCRETISPAESIAIKDSFLSLEQRAEIIARDSILIAYSDAMHYKDFKTSAGYQLDCNYISPNKYHHYDDREETDNWQLEVYLFALGLMVRNGFKTVADIGCGSGYKLVHYLKDYETIGVELAENVSYLKKTYPDRKWQESYFSLTAEIDADVIIFSDVIEHLVDPDLALAYIKKQSFKYLIISTPAREFLYQESEPFFYGPPRNPAHQREWTMVEFRAYIEKHFVVFDQRLTNYEQATQMIICKKCDS